MAVPPDVVQTKPQDESGNTWQYPPTALVYMARDQHTARGVGEMSKALAEQVGNTQRVSTQQCASCKPYVSLKLTSCSDVPADLRFLHPLKGNSRLRESMPGTCA